VLACARCALSCPLLGMAGPLNAQPSGEFRLALALNGLFLLSVWLVLIMAFQFRFEAFILRTLANLRRVLFRGPGLGMFQQPTPSPSRPGESSPPLWPLRSGPL